MKTIGATEFKTRCLALLDEVSESHEEFLILKRGKAVARVVPVTVASTSPQAALVGTMITLSDIVEPPLPAESWEAEGG
ncbi:MAG: type II toxin-antitoxin system Phd/YefM family antitoxin [Bradymonadales bacterium]|nr:type II toxin-antitoxin system Phd/YefM family antitoxin [Bradymonadales bacterium]